MVEKLNEVSLYCGLIHNALIKKLDIVEILLYWDSGCERLVRLLINDVDMHLKDVTI